jgi:hypothetical protein
MRINITNTDILVKQNRPSGRMMRSFSLKMEVLRADNAMAERQGFEPWMSFWPILTFQASAFDHSATAPHALDRGAP